MEVSHALVVAGLLVSALLTGATRAETNLVWSDEFNGAALDTNTWTFDTGNGSGGWGNAEREFYTSRTQNVYVANGVLHIVARRESTNGFAYTSARIKTEGLYARQYGRIEFRAKLPHGLGFWPALWMLGTNITSVGWPACGEVDVMESQGSWTNQAQGSIHYSDAGNNHLSQTKVYTLPTAGDSVTNFHIYALQWTTNAMTWLIDNQPIQTWTSWSSSTGAYPAPFNRPFFLIMNVAVGGTYVGSPDIPTIDANTTFPGEMQVDYVRIYDDTTPLKLSLSTTPTNTCRLDWPTDIVCHLQVQTNATMTGLTSNWLDLTGPTHSFSVPLDETHGSAYFRLHSP